MLRRDRRITVRLFETMMASSQRRHSSCLYVKISQNLTESRFSVVVPKKVCSTATGRNSLRRRIDAILDKNKDVLPKGNHIIFAQKGAEDLSALQLESEVKDLLSIK